MIGHVRAAAPGTVSLVLGRPRVPTEATLHYPPAIARPADRVANFVFRTPMVAHDGSVVLRMRMPPREHDRTMRQGLAGLAGNDSRTRVDRSIGNLRPI